MDHMSIPSLPGGDGPPDTPVLMCTTGVLVYFRLQTAGSSGLSGAAAAAASEQEAQLGDIVAG